MVALTAEWLAVEGMPWSAVSSQQSFTAQGVIQSLTGFTLLSHYFICYVVITCLH